jgi:multidrug efflux pump subunit AcrA (membrane-fusion protein)
VIISRRDHLDATDERPMSIALSHRLILSACAAKRLAPVRAGDEIRAGAALAAMDDRDLVLERLHWVTERQMHMAEYDQALGDHKRADAQRINNQIAQADAEIRLADEQLARARMTAPFDGLIVSGDLSQSIGAPVRRGDVLFEIAPLNDFRVELQVPESQIADIAPGQHGTLIVGALPDEELPLVIERVTPVADAKDGQMTFRADGLLGVHSPRLRPGMEGVAKVEVGRARLVWIWTRSFQHWLRLTTWSWLP